MLEEERWYAVRTKPGQEHIASECLSRQEFKAYYPRITVERAKHGRIVRDSEGLFPGYVLVMFRLAISSWRAINNTRGVIRLLSSSVEAPPLPLPIGEIERLQERERTGQLFISEVVRLRRGDRVRIKFGWAVDQIGTVVSTRAERVNLLLALLSREVRLIAPSHALELVSRASATSKSRQGRAEALPDFIRRPIIRAN